MPGHDGVFVGYPGTASGRALPDRVWGVFDPAMDPKRRDINFSIRLSEMAALFRPVLPYRRDEVNARSDANPKIHEFARHNLKDNNDCRHFNQRVQKTVPR
jgi:hypothetical protein